MVEVLIGNNEIILISKQELPQDLYEEMVKTKMDDESERRINACLKDLHNASYDLNGRTMEFSRKYTEQDINPNGLQYALYALAEDHANFIGFIKELMKEVHEKEKNEKKEKAEFSIKVENGEIHVSGNMDPLDVIAIALGLLLELQNDETE